jgi:hypothetical protein
LIRFISDLLVSAALLELAAGAARTGVISAYLVSFLPWDIVEEDRFDPVACSLLEHSVSTKVGEDGAGFRVLLFEWDHRDLLALCVRGILHESTDNSHKGYHSGLEHPEPGSEVAEQS